MDKVLNFDLLKHPMNWIIIFLMVLIVGMIWQLFMKYQSS